MARSVLVVDDDSRIRTSLADALRGNGVSVRTAESGEAALDGLEASVPDLVLADLKMPGMDGIELLQAVRARLPDAAVVIMTAHEDLPTVAVAMREGARDFLVKPLDLHQLRGLVERIFEDRVLRGSGAEGTDLPPATGDEGTLVGRDRKLIEIFKVVGRVAPTRTTVLIRGESGTGKELVAREIHRGSPVADQPFVTVTCTAVPETLLESELFGHVRGAFTGANADRRGRFALAGRGTIFLDEIGDISPEFQGKLLRVLQEHEYTPVGSDRPARTEARVLAATHRDLEQMVAAGTFREDLYYRLRVVEITMPPLRERLGDLPALAAFFVRQASGAAGRPAPALADEAVEKLRGHGWPGNVRELQHCLARAVVTSPGDVIRAEDIDLAVHAPQSPGVDRSLSEMERFHVARVLESTGGQKTRAARVLEISRPRLDRLIERFNLQALVRRNGDASEDAE